MKKYFIYRFFIICTLVVIGFSTIAQEKSQTVIKTKDCCNSIDQVFKEDPVVEYTSKNPVKDIEDDMILLSKNDRRVERLIDADSIWYREIKEGNFRTEKPNRFVAQNVPYDELRYVQIDEKIFYQFFVSEDNLIKKYNPKDIDFSIYRGYILWEAQEDITYVAEQFNNIDEIAKVEIVSQYFVKVYAPVEYVINTFGEDYLDPEDGEYPGYFTHLRLRTAPYLPLKSKFTDQLPEDKEYRTPYMRVFDLETGEKEATITMRPNAYPLLPVGFKGKYKELPANIYKNLVWVDIPTNEPIRKEIINIIHPKSGAKDAISDAIDVQIYMNAIEIDNDGGAPRNWVIEAWEGSYYIQVGAMRDDTGLLKNHNYARILDKFNISAINDASNITGVEYETYIANTSPTCWEAWYGGCDCITEYNEIGPKSYDIANNITSANNQELGGEKDFNSATWYDDAYDGTVYFTDPSWNWDKGDGYTNYDVVYDAAGITDFEGRLAGNWYVVGIKDKTEDDNSSTWWQGIETLNASSSLRVTFIPICGDTDLGTITPTSCVWQEAPYSAGTKPYWKFVANASYYYNFNLCSNSEDTRIRIYDSFNNEVATLDDYGPFCAGTSSSISWSPTTSGTYYISAAHYSCNTMYNDGIMYYSRSDDPWMRKGTITPTTIWQTSANTVGEINFWTFAATAGTAYAFNFCDIVEDTYIRIYDNTWVQQAFNDDNGPCCSGSASSTVWTCPTSGTYYIAGMHLSCDAFTTSGNLNYRISIPIASATVTDNTICAGESATLQGSGTTVCGTIAQYDWDHLTGDNNPQNPVVSPTSTTNYQLRVLDSNGTWSDWVSVSVVVYIPPTAPTGVSGTTTICNGYGTDVTLSATGGSSGSGSTYQWYADGCASGSVLGTGSSLTVSPSTTTIYYVRSVGTAACSSTFTTCANGTVTVNTPPTAPTGITNSGSSVCEGGSINLIATGGGSGSGSIYQWYADGCGSGSVLGTGSSLNVSPSITTIYYVRRVGSSPCNLTTTACAIGTVNVDPLPTASAGGSQTICSNGTATVSGASASNGTISWTEDGAGSITSGATSLTPVYTPSVGDAGNTVTLTMTVTSNNACNPQTATASYTVNVEPLPTASAGGSQTICSNGTATVSGASASNGTISWTEDGAGSITSG
ncbi:MAG: hypothetical protein PHW82_14495, partial [Bacteroidales bacterium]|nr:hypothetical protein [Bacteroidales bacterium]